MTSSSRQEDGESVNRVIAPTQDIYSQARQCQKLFNKYLETPRAHSNEVSDCQHRFLTWAGFLGVFASVNASLDARLRRAPEIKELVLAMLRVLNRNVERAILRHMLVDAQSSDTTITAYDVEKPDSAIYGMTGAIDRLHRLATAIRQSPRTDEVERVLNFASKREPDGFPTFILAMVQFQFPDAEPTLKNQLVESIVYRRHRMLWSRLHSKKLGRQRQDEEASQPTKDKKPVVSTQPKFNRSPHQHRGIPAQPKSQSSLSSTIFSLRPLAGVVNKNFVRLQEGIRQEGTASVRSSNPPPTAQYPDIPKIPAGESKVQCKYCSIEVEMELSASEEDNKAKWRKHINEDLRPYVCCSEECGKFPPSFSNSKTWKAHMQESHRSDWAQHVHRVWWSCPHCAKSFLTEDLLICHLKEDQVDNHPKDLDSIHLAKITVKAKVSNPRQVGHCPLCGPPPWVDPESMGKKPLLSSEEQDGTDGQPDTSSGHPNKSSAKPDTSSGSPDMSSGKPDTSTEKPVDLNKHFSYHLRELAFLSLRWWDIDTGEMGDSPDGGDNSADAIGFNSEVGSHPKRKMNNTPPLIDLEYNDLERLEDIRDNDEYLHRLVLAAFTANLDLIRPQLLNAVAGKIPEKDRLELVTGESFEPHYISDSRSVSRKWNEVGEELRYRKLEYTLREAQEKVNVTRISQKQNKDDADSSSDEGDALARCLADTIFTELINSPFQNGTQGFLPEGRIDSLITAESVASALPKLNPDFSEDLELFDFILSQAKKVFGITLLTMPYIRDLYTVMGVFRLQGFNDEELPAPEILLDSTPEVMLTEFAKEPWSATNRNMFFHNQWKFIAPVFHPSHFRYHLDVNSVLPIIWTSNSTRGSSLSDILPARIHPNHLQLTSQATDAHGRYDMEKIPLVAIKQMRASYKDNFLDTWEAEAKALKDFSQLNHAHIVRGIAAISIGQQRYLIYEWADGENLGNLWAEWNGMPELSGLLIMEVLVQLRGLADALHAIHTFKFEHAGFDGGDYGYGYIKPENILRFHKGESPIGTLKIAGVGVARRHNVSTQHRGDKNADMFGTVRYEPPEALEFEAPRSRPYDIWSLGCVIFEWMICLLYGYDELRKFTDSPHSNYSSSNRSFKSLMGGVPSQFTFSDPIIVMMYRIARDPECAEYTAMMDLQNLVKTRLLVASAEDRATANEVRNQLDVIIETAKIDESYLFSGADRSFLRFPNRESTLLKPDALLYETTVARNRLTNEYGHTVQPNSETQPNEKIWNFTVNNDFVYDLVETIGPKALRPPASIRDTRKCFRCEALDFSMPDFLISETFVSLTAKAKTCVFCRLLLGTVESSDNEIIRFRRLGSTIRLNNNPLPVLSICGSPGEFKCEIENHDLLTVSELNTHNILSPIQIGFPVLPEAGSETSFAIIKQWLKNCDTKHEVCTPRLRTWSLPTRVLDVMDSESPFIRLCQKEVGEVEDTDQYIALSHLWGHDHQFVTMKDNIEEFRRGVSLNALPATFRDAVTTTRALGIRYLWIDALCIIQDSHDDWTHEANHMGYIFGSAYCIIASVQVSTKNEGFLRRREEAREYVEFHGEEEPPLYVCSYIDDFNRDVSQSELCNRAWTLQERALARRTVFFTSSQIYMECGGGVRCETLTQMSNPIVAIFGDPNFPETTLRSSQGGRVGLFQAVYSHYSRLRLKLNKDRPHAIAGLEKRLLEAFRATGMYGVFEGDLFYRSILWQRADDEGSLERIEFSGSAVVPTWSWMAYTGAISYMDIPLHGVN